jgi:glycosyltransferase EpsH
MIKNNPLISIIVPVYNSEKYLDKCIQSIINQTYSNFELILINDGSKDSSIEICKKYYSIDNRIIIIDKENEGVSVARNKGIERAKGDWISFVDSDDWIEVDTYEQILNSLENEELDIILWNCFINKINNEENNSCLRYNKTIFNKEEINILQRKFLCKGIKEYKPYVWGIGAPWCKLYSSRLIKNNKLMFVPGLTRNEDGLFNLYAFEYSNKVMYIPTCYYHYRVLSNSLSHGRKNNIISDTEKNLEELIRFYKKFNKDNIFINGIYTRIITSTQQYLQYYYFYDMNIRSYNKGRKELLNLMKKDIYFNACNKVEYYSMSFLEKIYCFCFKNRLIFLLLLIVKARNILKR